MITRLSKAVRVGVLLSAVSVALFFGTSNAVCLGNHSIRLVGATVDFYGRVELCENGTRGTICADADWDNRDASVVCQQAGYSPYGSIALKGSLTEGVLQTFVHNLNCTGDEPNIWDCPHNDAEGASCDQYNDAAVICSDTDLSLSNCSDGDVRLVGGSDEYEGTVQVCINRGWGSVCSTSNRYYNYWNVDDGKVVCGRLGYQRLGSVVYASTPFGSVEGPSFLTNVRCSGSEESLLDCSKDFETDGTCSAFARNVGVKCQPPCIDGSVRLVNTSVSPPNIHQGRVEICVNNTWGTVCDDFWDNKDASVICHQLGYSAIGSVAVIGRNGEGTWPVHVNDINCTGDEENVLECPHNGIDGYVCNDYQDASVICYDTDLSLSNCFDGDVRLVGGSNEYEGTVEVCINRAWGSVCSTSRHNYYSYYNTWNINDGMVACGQLGYQRLGSTVYAFSPFGSVEGPSFLTNVGCSGSEESLLDCSNIFVTDDICSSHSRDVGLKCQPPCVDGSVRLVNTSVSAPTIHQGRVEICVNNTWGTVCDDFWDNVDARVICRQLGYSAIGSIALIGRNGERIWPIHVNDINCTGDEENIWECPHNGLNGYVCDDYQDASVICYDIDLSLSNCSDGDVRLVGGSNEYEGTVEVCINHGWGNVCLSPSGYRYYYVNWGLNDAKVVCGQLGFQRFGATVYSVTPFGVGIGAVFLHSIGCSGNEASILDCSHGFVTDATCFSHSRDVGLHCQPLCNDGSVRLASRDDSYFRTYGSVEVCEDGAWGVICVDHWDDNDASVVCQQLGYSRYGAVAGIAVKSLWPFHIEHLECLGTEDTYKHCASVFGSTCSSNREAFVFCQYTDTPYSNCDTGSVRLIEGETNTSGIVQVCRNKAWGTVCGDDWGLRQSRVVCRQLGFQDGYGFVLGSSSSMPRGKGHGPRLVYQAACTGFETNLSKCRLQQVHSSRTLYSCRRYNSAAVSCIAPCNDGDVELFGAGINRAGIVRVCVNNKWGKVCGNDVNNNELATVVCSQLGYSPFGAIAISGLWYEYTYIYSLFDVSCYGNETSLLQCQHRSDSSRCSRSRADVSVVCQQETTLVHPVGCSDGSVRLTGDSTNRGTVEVCRNKAWGSICYGSGFDSSEARVVCRQIGFPVFVGQYQTLSSPQVPPMFTDFSCSSSELSLGACRNPTGVTHSVSTCRVGVVGINCESQCVHNTLRLVDGPSANQGRVEVCGEGHWGTVCSDTYWDNTDAGVVCKQLGFSQYGAVAFTGLYSERNLIHLVHSLSCNGSEETILDCHRNFGSGRCGVRDDASVSCQDSAVFSNCTHGEVMLEGHSARNIGQPKVCFNSFWGSICARYYWTAVDNNVVCRELGFQSGIGAVSRHRSVGYALQPEQILPLRFDCRGSEEQLRDCPRYSLSTCSGGIVVTEIECIERCNEGDVRLTGSSDPLSGQVEVCVNQTWGTICAAFWNDNNTKVLCEQLGFSSQGAQTSSSYQNRIWPIHINDLNCVGDEDTIWDCPRDQSQQCSGFVRNAAVICSQPVPAPCTINGDVRLRGGTSEYDGRVEICLNGHWSTICNWRNWRIDEATVVCRQLGHLTAGASATTVGGGFGHIYDTFRCTGIESNLINCSEPQLAPSLCGHSNDVGVVCQAPCEHGTMQLISISAYARTDYGILEMCVNGIWRRVCGNHLDIRQASDVCRQLGHSKYGAVSVPYSLSNGQDQYVVFSCNGTEQMLFDCNYTISACTPSYSLLLTCQDDDLIPSDCTNFDVRLTDGTSNTTGTVEVCINKHWSTLCWQHFDKQDASVVCSHLGFQRYGSSTFIARPTNRTRLLINSLGCSGTESRISDCNLQFRTENSHCSNLNVAGVTCKVNCLEGSVRITGSSSPSSSQGRVDVCINSQWSTLCGDFWTDSHAMVACRQLGYSAYGSVPYQQRHESHLETALPVHTLNISCNGSEDNLLNCFQQTASDTCPSGHDAFVVCQNGTIQSNCSNWELRVPTMSAAKVEGRVELCYNKVWFSVFYIYQNVHTERVMCRSLGYDGNDGTELFTVSYLDRPYLLPFPFGLSCSSDSTELSMCMQSSPLLLYDHQYQIGVRCLRSCMSGDIRLAATPYNLYGRVEACVNGSWGTVCETSWDDRDASVVCRQSGFSPYGSVPVFNAYRTSSISTLINSLNCTGQERSIFDCQQSDCPTSNNDASIICQDFETQYSNCSNGTLRIRGGPNDLEGRLEICLNNIWGTVCGSSWDNNDATVACRQLGHQPTGVITTTSSFYGRGEGPSLYNFYCSGTEHSIFDCRHDKISAANCGDGYVAGIRCQESCVEGGIRLRGSSTRRTGRVEVCIQQSWTTICDQLWNDRDATVICQQLGFSPIGAIPLRGQFSNRLVPLGINRLNCSGGESNWTQCDYSLTMVGDSCNVLHSASVVCQVYGTQFSNCSDGDIRLSGDFEGVVEVCINNAWGTICDSNWGTPDGNVVCRQLGFLSRGSNTNRRGVFGLLQGPIHLSNVRCAGDEESLLDCQHDKLGTFCSRSHLQDAAVTCQVPCTPGDIQLAGRSDSQSGIVEVCINGEWGTICDSHWSSIQASLVCQQLGYSQFGAVAVRGATYLQDSVWPTTISQINCDGNETALFQCHINQEIPLVCDGLDAAVVCQEPGTIQANCTDGEVRLVGGSSLNEGRVEMCYNSAWGTICDDHWNREEASIVCRQLGFQPNGAVPYRNAHFGQGNGPIYVRWISCSGNEATLLDCPRRVYDLNSCGHNEDAGVFCEVPCTPGDIRLAGRSDSQSRRVEACINGEWGTICDSHWNSIQASLVCQQLGYSQFGAVAVRGATYLQDSVWPTTIFQIDCDGNETALFQCRINQEIPLVCDGLDAAVVCQEPGTMQANCTDGEVRLVGGSSLNEGRVEMCYNSAWGTICDDHWNREEASIVCRQLGFQPNGAVPYHSAHFGQGSGPIYVRWISCSGNEATLLDCPRRVYDLNSCGHNEDAGVVCEELCVDGNVRITGINLENIGRVEVCVNGTWGFVCNDQWDDMDASVVCNQLGFSPHGALSSQDFSHNSDVMPIVNNVNCLGNEIGLLNCSLDTLDSSVTDCSNAGIVCQATEDIEFSDCVSGQVRLSGGTVPNNGRVEMCISNAWGSVCDRHWNVNDGNVVCRQLGYQPAGAVPRYRSLFGSGSLPVIIGGLTCSGTENELSQCDRDDRALLSCSEHTVAGVECEELCDNGDIQLIGDSPLSGRVEVCANRTWETVCSDMWDDVDASIVCRQLGHSAYGSMSGDIRIPREARGPYRTAVQCSGIEETLNECSYVERRDIDCEQATIAGVICQSIDVEVSNCTHGDLRLVGGRRSNDGRLEVCINNVWGTVCDRGWSREDANVACGQLGYYPSEASPKYGSFYGRGMGPIHFANLQCSSSNQRLIECNRDVFASTSCHHYRDAGVKCQGSIPIQLSKSYGSLLGGEIVTVSGINFREDDTITCRFGDTMVPGDFLTSEEVACVTPAVEREGVVDFELKVTRHPTVLFGGSSFRFISPQDIDDSIEVVKSDDLVWRVGDVANIAWNPSSIAGDLVEDSSIKVDIHLLTYDVVDEQLKEDTMLMSAVPNNGNVMITLPNVTSISKTEYCLEIALLKISVNMSVSAFVSRKRSIFSNVGKILGKVLKYGKTFAIGNVKTSIARRLLCEAWRIASPPVNQQRLPPCPCRKDQALDDNRYVEETGAVAGFLRKYVFHKGSESCFRQANVRDFDSGQQCCFNNNGDIIPGSPNGGTADLVAPTSSWRTIAAHFVVDVVPWVLCCTGLFKDCSRYYDRRSADNCEDYPDRPPPARMFGDPHIVTLDGYQYTFNGKGEFVLLETSDGQFILQGRMTDIPSVSNTSSPSNASGTSFVALACKQIDSDTVQFEVFDGSLVAFVNGEETNFTDLAMLDFANVTLIKENDTLSARFSDGVVITADAKNGIISNIQVTIPDTFSSTRGLLGQYNGLEFDDLLPRNSSDVLSTNSSLKDIHYSFGITWIIDDPSDSIFTYSSSGSWDTYYQPLYQPIFEVEISDPILRIEAEAVCGDDQLCYFDIAATGNVDIGLATLDTVNDQKKVVALLKPAICDPPCVNGACTANDVCVCSAGYEGDLCELTVFEECNVSICENGGMCQIIAGDYRCECSEFFYGALCEKASERGPDVLVVALSVVGGVMGFAAVIICLSCILVCGCSRYKKRVPKDKKSSKTVESKQEELAMTNIYE